MTRDEAEALIKHTPEWIPGPCPWCGATTLDEAGWKCRPTQDQSGEYVCGTPDSAPDTKGLVHVINPAYTGLSGYLWHWHAVDIGYTSTPPEWEEPEGAMV